MKIVALAGGVGGAKLAYGLDRVCSPGSLTLIVNTGDDFEHLGLWISPDLDTVCYTLAEMANPATGWGLDGDTFAALHGLSVLGGLDWFQIGDRDLATHLERTRRLKMGQPLSRITRDFCRSWGVQAAVLPMSDQRVSTLVDTVDSGRLAFQEYFVHRQCRPVVSGFHFEGVDSAQPTPGVLEAISAAGLIVICPSNPWVSIEPILQVQGIHAALRQKVVVAVSPIVGGKAIKGPAAKMYAEMGLKPTAETVARQYGELISGMVVDLEDRVEAERLNRSGIISLVTQTVMRSPEHRCRLASEVVQFGESLLRRMTGS